jgi:hypothetical protein
VLWAPAQETKKNIDYLDSGGRRAGGWGVANPANTSKTAEYKKKLAEALGATW